MNSNFLFELSEKLADARARYSESKQTSVNCYAAGYDLGCVDTLVEVIDLLNETARSSHLSQERS